MEYLQLKLLMEKKKAGQREPHHVLVALQGSYEFRERNGGNVGGGGVAGLEWPRRMLEGSWTCMGSVSGEVGCRYDKGAQSVGDTAPSIRFQHHFVAMVMNKAER